MNLSLFPQWTFLPQYSGVDADTEEANMADRQRTLDYAAAQAYYDRFGKKQDSQGFYEDRAIDDLVGHAGFEGATRVFEFGCGTGKFAARVFEKHLPASASYVGCDISPVMVGLAKGRLERYGSRAEVVLSEGAIRFPVSDRSVDRVVSCYVLDLLSEEDIRGFFREARRVLMPGGKVCIASLTRGVSFGSRIVSSVWTWLFSRFPALVGGCRPIDVAAFASPEEWRVVHQKVVTPFGVPSGVLVLETANTP